MFRIPEPELQVSFAQALLEIRKAMLQDALRKTVRKLPISEIDKELSKLVSAHSLASLAGNSLRGEYFFPVPVVLKANPRLIGYYRLLYGYSQKEFYKSEVAGCLKAMEIDGLLSPKNLARLGAFCQSMAKAGALLLASISTEAINTSLLYDLTLLTLGPQLRGGANVKLGTAAILGVFGILKEVVEKAITDSNTNTITLKNAAGRTVFIEFASDPDIIIREALPSGNFRHVVAIEVKGGRDFSNVHNRIGEAEKSHQKARANNYTECWTVVNVDNIDLAVARRESPSTDRFYRISDLISGEGTEFKDFRDRVVALTGIA